MNFHEFERCQQKRYEGIIKLSYQKKCYCSRLIKKVYEVHIGDCKAIVQNEKEMGKNNGILAKEKTMNIYESLLQWWEEQLPTSLI